MPRSPKIRRLSPGDIHLCKSAPGVLQLLGKLGYAVDPGLTPLPKEEIGFAPADAAAIRDLYLLAEQAGQGHAAASLQVILFELQEVALPRLRSLAANLLNRGGNYLLLATGDYQRLVFVNPRREGGRVKIAKLVVDTTHPTRHDLDVLEGLAVTDHDPEALYRAHCAAFDVEQVTDRFYREYADLFRRVEQAVRDYNKGVRQLYEPQAAHAFAQRLLGRIMFLYFIQKKGWLADDPHFLTNGYRTAAGRGDAYYATVLEPLFFATLNRRRPGDRSPWGAIPYLNGGLFDRDYDFPVYLPDELFDPASDTGILGFFNNYNFTVAEDTPVEQEVAVDPEMLGKVFENMMEEQERGRSGTFYTPRPVVHYMCREALLGYLEERTNLDRELLSAQFDEDASQILTVAQAGAIERALDEVRVLDPAVGTGAFLVGILHELVSLKRACFRARGVEVPRSSSLVAGWKRHFIAEALHGVDIKPEAIEIAKLRLWLSLVVDLDRDQVEPLPNLDYKLMVGDSLIETIDGQPILAAQPAAGRQPGLGLSPTEQAIAGLSRLKERFFAAGPEERPALRAQIQAQETTIVLNNLQERLDALQSRTNGLARQGAQVNWRGMQREERELERLAAETARLGDLQARIRRGEALPFFLYRLHFFPVLAEKGGFDIVIANPPYVRMELIKEQKAALQAAYPQVYDGRADLYVYFYARGLDLLRPGGMLAYISSNKFMRARYGEGLRQLLSSHTTLQQLIDFGELPVFEATAYPCIVITRKADPPAGHRPQALVVRDLDTVTRLGEQFPAWARRLPRAALDRRGWSLEGSQVLGLVAKLRSAGRPLAEVVKGQFYRGIVTGLNQAFVIDEATRQRLVDEDPHSAEIIKPWLRGRDVKRWRVEWEHLYVIFTYHGIDIQRYPAVLRHLQPFRERLEARATSANHAWYELQQPQMGMYPEFEKPKIVYPEFAARPTFAYDASAAYYVANKLYVIPTEDLSLLAILNSAVVAFLLPHMCSLIRGGYIEFRATHLGQVPIPEAPPLKRQVIEGLVQRLLDLRGEGSEAARLEQELNERVYRLFGLTEEEVRLIEGTLAGRGEGSE